MDGQDYAIKKINLNIQVEQVLQSEDDSPNTDRYKLLREVKTFAALSHHPHVLRYYNAWIEPAPRQRGLSFNGFEKKKKKEPLSVLYIQMQLCLSNDLRIWIDKRGKSINVTANTEILYQILSGLAHIHDQNIIHRDVKPENVSIQI